MNHKIRRYITVLLIVLLSTCIFALNICSTSAHVVDTGENATTEAQNRVNAAASAAAEAESDPDALSSQDWSAILSVSSAQSSSVSSQVSSAASTSSGGFPTLLAIGIGLIVVGLAGVGTFIYLQFIKKRPGGPGGPKGPGDNPGDDTMVFTDISSYSDGKKHDDGSALRNVRKSGAAPKAEDDRAATVVMPKMPVSRPAQPNGHAAAKVMPKASAPRPAQPKTPAARKPDVPQKVTDDHAATAVMPKVTAARKPEPSPKAPDNNRAAVQKPQENPVEHKMNAEERLEQLEENRLKKSQAKPVENGRSDFNWEKFFNDIK